MSSLVTLDDVKEWEEAGTLLRRLVDDVVPNGIDENGDVTLAAPDWFKQFVTQDSQQAIMTELHAVVKRVLFRCIEGAPLPPRPPPPPPPSRA